MAKPRSESVRDLELAVRLKCSTRWIRKLRAAGLLEARLAERAAEKTAEPAKSPIPVPDAAEQTLWPAHQGVLTGGQ